MGQDDPLFVLQIEISSSLLNLRRKPEMIEAEA